MEVTVLMEGLIPYAGYTPVMAAVWDTHAAGSMGRIGSPVEGNVGKAVEAGGLVRVKHKVQKKEEEPSTDFLAEQSSSEGLGPSTWPQLE